jgi:ABC-type glycerol-3-phosphate transport system substrate-binding protein
MSKIRITFFVVLTILTIAALTPTFGCKPVAVTTTTTEKETAAATETTAPSTTEAKPAYDIKAWAGTEITIAIDDRIENQRMKKLIPQFEEATGIKVKIEEMPEATLFDKINLDIESGTGIYDVIMHDFTRPSKYGPKGLLFSIDDYVKDPKLVNPDWFSLDKFPEAYVNGLKAEGKLYGLPLFCTTNLLTIRADLLEAKGLKPPETMDDLVEVLKQITSPPNVYGIGYRGLAGQLGNIWPWSGFLATYGGKWFDENWKPAFNNPEGVKATEMFVKLLKDYGAPGQVTWHWAELQSAFLDGKLAMVWDCDVFRSRAEDPSISKVAGKLGSYYVPYAKETGKRSTGFWAWGVMIPGGAKNKEAAWQFVQWWTSADVGKQCEYPSQNDAISNIWGKFSNPEGWPTVSEVELKSMADSDPNYRPNIPELPEVGDRIGIAINEVMTGKKSAQQALDDAAKDVEKIMKEAGYY